MILYTVKGSPRPRRIADGRHLHTSSPCGIPLSETSDVCDMSILGAMRDIEKELVTTPLPPRYMTIKFIPLKHLNCILFFTAN